MSTSTHIFNATKHTMKLLVGSSGYASELATVEAGEKYTIAVDFNATYREYFVQIDAPGLEKIVVSSDDLCDFKGITIKEDDGKLNAVKDPRESDPGPIYPPSQPPKKSKLIPAWMSRLRGNSA